MRQFLLKTVIIVIAVYILFQFTLGYRIDGVTTKIKSISNQHQRIEFKEKINYCVATTSDIVDLNSNYSVFYSRIRILRENILTKIK